jgi:hypothetical protein
MFYNKNQRFDNMNRMLDGMSAMFGKGMGRISGRIAGKVLHGTTLNLLILDANGVPKVSGMSTLVRHSNHTDLVTARHVLFAYLPNGTWTRTGTEINATTPSGIRLALMKDVSFAPVEGLNVAWMEVDTNITPVTHCLKMGKGPLGEGATLH